MKRYVIVPIASIFGLVSLVAGTASAQTPPFQRPYAPYNPPQPLLSPYLNMLRGGDPSANYYLGVVPERDRRRNDVLFRSELLGLEQRTQPLPEGEDVFTPLRSTGHMTAFGYTGTYFGTTRTQTPATQAPANRPPATSAARPPMR